MFCRGGAHYSTGGSFLAWHRAFVYFQERLLRWLLEQRDPQRAAALHEKLKQWRNAVGASMPVANPNYDPATAHQGLTGENPRPDPPG